MSFVPCPAVVDYNLDVFVPADGWPRSLPSDWECVFCGATLTEVVRDATHTTYPTEVDTVWRLGGRTAVKALLATHPDAFPEIKARVDRGWR